MSNFVELVLTCASWQEAQRIADVLLDKRMIACAEFIEVKSRYRWQSSIQDSDEIKLIMQSSADNFKIVEAEVAQLHSYDTFVLRQIPMTNLSASAQKWLTEETKQG